VTPERLRALILVTLAEHPDVITCRPTKTVYLDRLAVAVETRDGALWRVHVLKDPLR
jgi:hypothetical protein